MVNTEGSSPSRCTTLCYDEPMTANIIDDFHLEYYRSGVWGGNTFWRGHRIEKFPTDLVIYQEIIHEIKPGLIIECGTRFGGSAVFLGDMCRLVDRGHVISIDKDPAQPPYHPLVRYICGDSTDPKVAERIVFPGTVMVILDSDHSKEHVLKELDLWSPHVSPGSYLIVEDTNLSGHPVCAEMNGGPWEALEEWLPQHSEFEVDRSREKFLLTTNPGGYLRRKI